MGEANSSQGLAPHTPRRRLSRLLFLCLGVTPSQMSCLLALPAALFQVRVRGNNLLGVRQVCESCHDHDRDDHCAAKESDVW